MKATVHYDLYKQLSCFSDSWQKDPDASFVDIIQSLDWYRDKILKQSIFSQSKRVRDQYHASFLHFVLYFLSRLHHGFILPLNSSLFFGSFFGRNKISLQFSCPLYSTEESMIHDLKTVLETSWIKKVLRKYSISSFLLRDINQTGIDVLKNSYGDTMNMIGIKEIPYALYDLENTVHLKGNQYSNIRWHLNKFDRHHHIVEHVETVRVEKPLLHLIGQWRRNALKQRGFSFANVDSDKIGAKLITTIPSMYQNTSNGYPEFHTLSQFIYRVLRVDGKISSFHLGFPMGFVSSQPTIAHAIGITDISIPHLSEYAQIDFWNHLLSKGFRYVNDGPTWRQSLEQFKMKFRPLDINKSFWIRLS